MTPLSQALSPTPSSRIGPIEYPTSPRRLGEDSSRETEPPTAPRGEDRVELSAEAQRSLNASQRSIRADLVTRVRGEIAAGTYESAEKVEIAVRRVVGELNAKQ